MTDVTYIIAVDTNHIDRELGEIPGKTERDLVKAVNKITPQGRTMASRGIRRQVNFPASYLNSDGRLEVTQKANRTNITGIIRGRNRPTSLARFTKDGPLDKGERRRPKGIKVSVKPGVSRYLKRAFLIRLRSGNEGALGNVGMAIRSEEQPSKAYKPKKIGKNLWLLYGPSVSQILYHEGSRPGGVAVDIAPELADKLEAEFLRLRNLDLP